MYIPLLTMVATIVWVFPCLADDAKFDYQWLFGDSFSLASALDYRNVRCVSQSNYYHTMKGIWTKYEKPIPILCNAQDQVNAQNILSMPRQKIVDMQSYIQNIHAALVSLITVHSY